MTNRDIFIQILHEVSGEEKAKLNGLLDMIKHRLPPGHKLDEELTDEKANQLLSDLRKEKLGILQWLHEGRQEMEKLEGHA
ncbi:hypothetical protein [Desulfofustis limnaeus]|uniref:Uncharacterized protein n=1 Tax=Desulfofustis limnaeus TaxID=2740163 RepID=A0ABN6M7B7_9BACT|nr:hypothetical protein [Desulfofustis limnaeus]BDD88732.1 hypothetical protein DPPLL_30970 [Desulfofustis limnaeus]